MSRLIKAAVSLNYISDILTILRKLIHQRSALIINKLFNIFFLSSIVNFLKL